MEAINKEAIEDYTCYRAMVFLSNEVNVDRLAKAIHEYQESKAPSIMNIEAKIREISKKMTNIITTIETGLDPVDLKGRYNELKPLRDELEHELDEEKCHNPIMSIDDIKLTLSRCRTISLNSLKEKKILIDLMINSVILNGDRSIDIVFN